MIPERFSVLGFFYPGMNPASHKKCVAISGNFPECIFVSRFPGSILVKNGASGYPFWDCLFLSKPKCAHALLPFRCHSGIKRIRRRMFWVHSRNNPNKNDKSAEFWPRSHRGAHFVLCCWWIHSNFGNLWLAWLEMIQWTHTTHDRLLKTRAWLNKCYRMVLTILKNDFLIFILCCDLFLLACDNPAIPTQGAIATFTMINPPRRAPLFCIHGSFVRELTVTAMWS